MVWFLFMCIDISIYVVPGLPVVTLMPVVCGVFGSEIPICLTRPVSHTALARAGHGTRMCMSH